MEDYLYLTTELQLDKNRANYKVHNITKAEKKIAVRLRATRKNPENTHPTKMCILRLHPLEFQGEQRHISTSSHLGLVFIS